MSFTLVNKNLLIPQTEVYLDFITSAQKLLDMSYNADKTYCSNLYVVSKDCIYFTNGHNLYTISSSNLVEKIDVKIPNKSHLKILNSFLSSENSDTRDNNKSDNTNCDMDIEFNVKNLQNKITVKDDLTKKLNNKREEKIEIKNEVIPKSKEELELLKLCEETMEIYQNEVRKMKEIEKQIKVLECNKKSLLKKQREKLFGNFSKFKNDYNTFKMIKNKLEKKPDMDIPSLFALKYNYFDQLSLVPDNLIIIKLVEDLNLDEVLNTNCELDEKLEIFINNYGQQSKKLNVKFDHSWEDLELETDVSETNNSRFGNI